MKLVKFLLFAIGAIFISNIVSAQSGDTPITDTTAIAVKTIKVKGVTCANDLKTIAGNVEKLKGVISCKSEKPGPTTRFSVRYNAGLITEKEINAAIEGTEGCEDPNDRPYKVKR